MTNDLKPTHTSALVLFSGGQDSTTCLAWACDVFDEVQLISFDYGQRHRIELECRHEIIRAIGQINRRWQHKITDMITVPIPTLGVISTTALTSKAEFEMTKEGLPNTFVPGRNIFFLTTAAAIAYRRGVVNIVSGMCEADYGGYPDCREEALRMITGGIELGMAKKFQWHYPVLHRSKADTWRLANDLGVLDVVINKTHTCYRGERGNAFDWGYGCGSCPACDVRAKGYQDFRAQAA